MKNAFGDSMKLAQGLSVPAHFQAAFCVFWKQLGC